MVVIEIYSVVAALAIIALELGLLTGVIDFSHADSILLNALLLADQTSPLLLSALNQIHISLRLCIPPLRSVIYAAHQSSEPPRRQAWLLFLSYKPCECDKGYSALYHLGIG